jgi:hypothetical protein
MNYCGPLFGKVGRHYIPMRMSAEDVDMTLEALESVWPFLQEDDGNGCNSPAYQAAINGARAAIIKAKGGAA